MAIQNTDLLGTLKTDITPRIPLLAPDIEYELSEIAGDELWAGLDNGTRRHLGRLVNKMAANGEIPLMFIGKSLSNNHSLYMRAAA